MKSTSFFINMSRGPVVKENDLILALEKNIILGAGLDVMNNEPINKLENHIKYQNGYVS